MSVGCVVCGALNELDDARTASVRSNVRAFAQESFVVWQCQACGSIHARDEVDLDHYYAQYPFHGQTMNLGARIAFRNKLRHLQKHGLTPDQRVLDYGCGAGMFVEYLRGQGFAHASGYDAYGAEPYRREPGEAQHVIVAQDVIEHVAEPYHWLASLRALTLPGGLIVLGTPDAARVDLATPERFLHVLHQPYHRHILSQTGLDALTSVLKLELVEVVHGFYGSSWLPGLNARYLERVLHASGDVLDDVLAGKVPLKGALFTPAALWDAFTGSQRDPGMDMTVVLRVPR